MLKEGVLVLFLRRPLTFVVKGEDKMDAGAPQVDSAEITSPKGKVIRVESEETQDYVCGVVAISPEEAEGFAFCAEYTQRAVRSNLLL